MIDISILCFNFFVFFLSLKASATMHTNETLSSSYLWVSESDYFENDYSVCVFACLTVFQLFFVSTNLVMLTL